MPLQHLPLQRRLVIFIFLTSLSVLLLSYLALLTYETRSSKQATVRNLSTLSDIIASNSAAALIYDDQTFATELLSGLREEPDIIAAVLFDKQGRVFATYRNKAGVTGIPIAPGADGTTFTLNDLTLYRPVTQGSARVGTLFVKSDLGAMYHRLQVYGLVLTGVLIGAGVLALLLSSFFQRRISHPILDLAETARTVSERKDYSVRATKRTGDELGFVTDAFNTMLDQIQLNHSALGESEARFRMVADSAPVLIWMTGPDGLRTWFNQRWLSFTGRTMADEVGKGWMGNVHPDDRELCLTTGARAFDGRKEFQMEYRLRRHDGNYRWLVDHGMPRYQGDEFEGFIGSSIDITERKQAEALARSSELQMRLVTDHAPVFLCELDADHRYKFLNRAYAERYGKEPQDLLGMHLSEVIGPAGYALVRSRIESALAGDRQEFELELPYPTMGRRQVHLVYEPERLPDGRVAGIVSVLTDMTERRQAEQELKNARDRAVAASHAKDDFLAALSHELRTPLNPVLLLASDAAANPQLAPGIRASFETIRKNVEMEARLIDDLLDLTRVTRGKLALDQRAVDAHVLINDALDIVRAELEAKQITVALALGRSQPKVWGDSVRLQQVLWNVLKNAVKFTPENGRITVVTERSTERRMLTIRITDTGIGMVPAELDRIFDAFVQGDHADGGRSHRFGGLGLGLAISRRIIELHRGQIIAASAGRNQGCTFTIELPVMKSKSDTASPTGMVAPASVSRDHANDGHLSILLVEDHAPTRMALESLLKRRQYQVHVAGTVAEARAVAQKETIDVVISDIGLPDGTGFELMEELKNQFGLKGIALTGYGMESDFIRSQEAGFVTHLMKPIRIQALDEAVAALVTHVQRS